MKDKITLKEFFESKEKLAIHCNTEEKANKLLKEFDEFGKIWRSGESYLQYNNFNDYKDKTCYSNDGEFCEIKYFKDNDYKIYSFEDVIFEENKPKNLIPQIAEMLGVEIGEEFEIKEKAASSIVCKFTDTYLLSRYKGEAQWSIALVELGNLLSGKWRVRKLFNKPHLTEDEKTILRNLPKQYKWIARDKSGTIHTYTNKPEKFEFYWCDGVPTEGMTMFSHLFQFIKWEDKEPYNIEELLKGE